MFFTASKSSDILGSCMFCYVTGIIGELEQANR